MQLRMSMQKTHSPGWVLDVIFNRLGIAWRDRYSVYHNLYSEARYVSCGAVHALWIACIASVECLTLDVARATLCAADPLAPLTLCPCQH